MNQTLGILFYLKRAKALANGEVPIYLRITVDGKRAELSVQRSILPSQWNGESMRAKGKSEGFRALNTFLDSFLSQVHNHQARCRDRSELMTSTGVKNALLGLSNKKNTLIDLFTFHNGQIEQLSTESKSKGTFKKYKATLQHVIEFLKTQYRTDDVFLAQLDNQFITGFDHYFRTVAKCNNNTTVKYISMIRKVVRIAVDNDWLEKDPFRKYKSSYEVVDRPFLSGKELKTIEDKEFKIERLNQVRDIFVFSCYTGLAYCDVLKLTPDKIVLGIDKHKWIYTHRTKTKTRSNIPLLPKALQLIDKYKNHPISKIKGKVFPVLSNQKMNSYLKEIADFCGIEKTLTYHIARHTFATTVTLTNGVPLETVSALLGHNSLKTTQIYAKVIQEKLGLDMQALKSRLKKNTSTKKKTLHKVASI